MKQTTGTVVRITRRHLLGLGLGAMLTVVSAECHTDQKDKEKSMTESKQEKPDQQAAGKGRLTARPRQVEEAASQKATSQGQQRLGIEGKRDGLLYVPAGYRANQPTPLALMLHGAGGDAHHGLSLLQRFADEVGLILLAPASRRQTWDVILGGYGDDVRFIDRALGQTFNRYNVDPRHVAIGGFSDGASYALSLGLTNGDLFTHVIAFSPGFMAPAGQTGRPRFFVSHGTGDQVLPINVCSRKIVPQVKRAGYDVRYHEFDGPHVVPPEIAREALNWFIA